ncbi:MAG: HD domain-containing protein [Candidatus Neomarinimicrobiota bacterium]|tara:strand:- start:20 stop:595 length:576 start_codon:yes stop_codon:yes gene_type:complete
MANYPDRSEAIKLLHEYTKTDSLRRHALGVEQSMRKMADKYNGDPDEWGLTGLMHDFDYEMYPTMEDHPFRGNEILIEKGYPESITKAIMGHATYTGVPRDTDMAKSLFSVDELTGFIFAVTYVRPSKSILEVKPKSVKKKLKQKSFAASVIREDIFLSIEELGVDLTEHIQFVIDALSEKAEELGLKGNL